MQEIAAFAMLIGFAAFIFFLLKTIYLKIRGREINPSKKYTLVSLAVTVISLMVGVGYSTPKTQTKVAATVEDSQNKSSEKAEQERLAAEKVEQERLAAEKVEQERLAAEKVEQERLAAEKVEQERLAAEKAEQERLAAEKVEQERLAAEKVEQERLAAEKVEKKRLEEQRKAEETAKKETEMVAKYGDKATVKAYLEKTQPFAALDFIKSYVCGIKGPLANGDVENLRGYAFYIFVTRDEFKNSVANYGKIAKMCQEYYSLEGDIAAGYFKAKKNGIFSLNTVTTTADLAKQTKLKADIYSVANWCGADLNEFAETEFIQRAGGAIKEFLAKHPPTD